MSATGPGDLYAAVLRRELQVAFRRPADLANPVLFYMMIAALFPLALSPKAELLRSIAPGVLWIGPLLAMLLSLNHLFRADIEDGSLEQIMVMPVPLAWAMLAKTTAHWLMTGLPLLLMAPILAITYHLPRAAAGTLALSLLIGTPTLSLLGSIGAALTAGVRQGGALLAVMVLPLALPVLMFGARATDLAIAGESAAGPLYILGAMLALATVLVPLASAAAIRISVD